VDRGLQRESVFGWLRLGCTCSVVLLVPTWLLLSGFIHQLHPVLRAQPWWLGLTAAGVVAGAGVGVAGLVVALLVFLIRRAWDDVLAWQRDRDLERYASIVGDGDVLRPDAWDDHTAVDDVPESSEDPLEPPASGG